MKISISHVTTTRDPFTALEILADEKMSSDVDVGWSVVDGRIEHRLTIYLFDVSVPRAINLWLMLQEAYNLTCAWFEDDAGYAGCIKKHPDYHVDKLQELFPDPYAHFDA